MSGISGNLLSQIKCHDVEMVGFDSLQNQRMVYADQIVVDYSLFRFLVRSGGDLLSSIQQVTFKDMQVDVRRTMDAKWNFFDFIFALTREKKDNGSVQFFGKLVFENVWGSFQDDLGWGKAPLAVPFETSFSGVNGELDFSNPEKSPLDVAGVYSADAVPMAINGVIDVTKGALPF